MPAFTEISALPQHRMTRDQALHTISNAEFAAAKPIWFRELAWLTARERHTTCHLWTSPARQPGGDAA